MNIFVIIYMWLVSIDTSGDFVYARYEISNHTKPDSCVQWVVVYSPTDSVPPYDYALVSGRGTLRELSRIDTVFTYTEE